MLGSRGWHMAGTGSSWLCRGGSVPVTARSVGSGSGLWLLSAGEAKVRGFFSHLASLEVGKHLKQQGGMRRRRLAATPLLRGQRWSTCQESRVSMCQPSPCSLSPACFDALTFPFVLVSLSTEAQPRLREHTPNATGAPRSTRVTQKRCPCPPTPLLGVLPVRRCSKGGQEALGQVLPAEGGRSAALSLSCPPSHPTPQPGSAAGTHPFPSY